MIHYIDQTSERDHHMVFNSSILKMLMEVYPDENITSHGIYSNQLSTRELLSKKELKNVTFQTIEYQKSPYDNKFFKAIFYLKKEQKRKKLFKELLKTTTSKDLIFLSITTFTSFAVFKKLKSKFPVPTIAVLHGDLDYVYHANTNLEKMIGSSYKKVFTTYAPNFYYLLLNKISKKIVVADGYLKEDEVLEIDHPYNMKDLEVPVRKISDKKTISFGHIGSMEVERKNSQLLYAIAKKFSNQVDNNLVSFQAIGLITPGIIPFKNKWVEEAVGNKQEYKPDYLSRDEYEAKLASLNYSLFFYDDTQYVFRASGAVIDAIACAIPFIVIKHPIFDYIFEKAGNVGFRCENSSEMELVIQKLIERDASLIDQYENQVANLIDFRKKISIEYVAYDFEQQFIQRFS